MNYYTIVLKFDYPNKKKKNKNKNYKVKSIPLEH
jgi:hypothetical protein